MKSHGNHRETLCCVPPFSVNKALMLPGVNKASHCGQTLERCKGPNVRLPVKQQGGKFLTSLGSDELVGLKKLNRQQEMFYSF